MARYRMFRGKSGKFFLHDAETGKQKSLKTSDGAQARRILNAHNESEAVPEVNHKIAVAYLCASDPEMSTRTWETVFAEFVKRGGESTRERKCRAVQSRAFDLIRSKKLIDTTSSDFLAVLERGNVSANMFLRKVHNLAVDLDWLPKRVLARKVWPSVRHKKKRAITWEEHSRIVAREKNDERRLYYELLWETGASQGDAARLTASHVDWEGKILIIHRRKIEHHDPIPAQIGIGVRLESILKQLPGKGVLFPYLATVRSGDRATEFKQRCEGLKIAGVTLHSYRYAWAQRAKTCGYPERFAMSNLGHQSKAVHRAYAEAALVVCPPLEQYEAEYLQRKLIPFPAAALADAQSAKG